MGAPLALVVVMSGCFGRPRPAEGGTPVTVEQVPVETPGPIVVGHWSYYGAKQGLSADVHDVSPDEGGNVYVAGDDALYAKGASAPTFDRFDWENAGLTKNCNDPAQMNSDTPTTPYTQCPVISVAGAAPGKVIVGFQGFGIEADNAAAWARRTGGMDVAAFDPAQKAVSRTRHVFIASPPHVVCHTDGTEFAGTCSDPNDYWWVNGRRLVRQALRIVVNHDPSSAMYGDVWVGGNHGTFSALLANAAARGWKDLSAGWGPDWVDATDVREHLHPAITDSLGYVRLGAGYALSIDPRNGTVWGSNGIRTTWVTGYGADLSDPRWWMGTFYDIWPDSGDNWYGPTNDEIRAVSHCPDGTLWIGSLTHGLARIDTGGAVTTLDLPDPSTGDSVTALACDPGDSSLWIGLGTGGLLRLVGGVGGTFQPVDASRSPEFASHPVASIQIDRWSTPRKVWVAFAPATDATTGAITAGGGVGAYDGD
jgi:hypothetical protein